MHIYVIQNQTRVNENKQKSQDPLNKLNFFTIVALLFIYLIKLARSGRNYFNYVIPTYQTTDFPVVYNKKLYF